MTTTLDAPPLLTDDELAERKLWRKELNKCSADAGYMIDTYGIIDLPRSGALGEDVPHGADLTDRDERLGVLPKPGTVRFRLWPTQVGLIGTLASERLVQILKARQLGISWVVCGYVLWACLLGEPQVALLLSKGQAEANELIRRIKALYDRLPERLRALLPALVRDRVSELEWANGSKVFSKASTKSAGVSYTASIVVIDEATKMIHGAELYAAVKPIMDAGGQMILLSTAESMGDWFHSLWTKAKAGLNSFKAIFLPWWARPGRDWAWYQKILADSNDPAEVRREYPANDIEAFRAGGKIRFSPEWIDLQLPNIQEPLPQFRYPGELRGIPGLRLYQVPLRGHRYFIPADVAEGLESGDYDAAPIIDLDTLEEVGCLHGHWEPDQFAVWLIAIGEAYNWATIIPERNNHGHAVLATLRLKRYPNVGEGHDGGRGWLTNTATKDPGVDLVAECLRKNLITVRSNATVSEMSVYQRDRKGKTSAPAGFHDDLVMAWVVGLSWLRNRKLKNTGSGSAGPEVGETDLGFVTGYPRAPGHLPVPGLGRQPLGGDGTIDF